MSTAALTLEPSTNLLGKQHAQEPELKPYTLEKINAEIDESLADIAAGRVYTTEQVFKSLKEDLGYAAKSRCA